MTHLTKSLVVLSVLLGASAAVASGGDLVQLRQQLQDGTCLDQGLDGTDPACPLVAEQDQTQDKLQLKDGSCLDGDGTGAGTDTGDQLKTRTRSGADNGKGEVTRSSQ